MDISDQYKKLQKKNQNGKWIARYVLQMCQMGTDILKRFEFDVNRNYC